MKKVFLKIICAAFLVVNVSIVFAQGFGSPLIFQGVDNLVNHSVVSRGNGGVMFGIKNDASVMFYNPAGLNDVKNLQISVTNISQFSKANQKQDYGPLSYYSNFSLLMEGLTDLIPTPVYDTTKKNYTAADTVQRPFDKLGPNWDRSHSKNIPVQAFAAIPFTVNNIKITLGAGMVQYADMNWYFQNNNALSPSILEIAPLTTSLPRNNADSSSIPVQWHQSIYDRSGSINGYGGSFSLSFSENLSFGFSGLLLKGETDDKEIRAERGRLRFYQSYFRAETVYYNILKNGKSKFSGQEFTVSGSYKGKFVGFGFAVTPPTTITRDYSGTTKIDTTLRSLSSRKIDSTVSKTTSVSYTDKMTIPFRSTLAMNIALRENLSLGVEYEIRPLASAEYENASGKKSKPWLSKNLFHIGLDFYPADWLNLRCGVRENAEVFQQVGNALSGEPVQYTIFSLGGGVNLQNIRLNLAYEYFSQKYVDAYASVSNINTDTRHAISASVAYDIPWGE